MVERNGGLGCGRLCGGAGAGGGGTVRSKVT